MGAAKHPAFPAPSQGDGWSKAKLGRDRAAGIRALVLLDVVPAITGQDDGGQDRR